MKRLQSFDTLKFASPPLIVAKNNDRQPPGSFGAYAEHVWWIPLLIPTPG